MATKSGSGGGFFRPSAPTPVVGTIYDTSMGSQEPAGERDEAADIVQTDPSPSARLDAIANVLLIDLTSTHVHWEPVAALLRRYLETHDAGMVTQLWTAAAWSQVHANVPIPLHWTAYHTGIPSDSEPVIMYGKVQDTDLDAVAYAAGGGFRSADVDFEPLDED